LARDGHRVYASDAGDGEGARTAAAALAGVGVDAATGGHDLARIGRAALVVASPGVPPEAPPLAAAAAAGVPVVGEVEIGLHYLPALRYVAITGTNGKTTTTAIAGHLLRALGRDAIDAGNIGTPLTELALRGRPPAWAALELSSFQLHDTPSVDPAVGVVTNLSPDHLDRYPSLDAYYGDKARLFANARAESRWVLNGDDAEVPRAARQGRPRRAAGRDADVLAPRRGRARPLRPRGGRLVLDGAALLPRAELPLLGDHNVANALAAALAVWAADAEHRTPAARARMADALRTFRALTHRMEPVGTYGGVEWINDSKATNVSSTLVALQGMTRPYVLLLGGRHKGEAYTALADAFAARGARCSPTARRRRSSPVTSRGGCPSRRWGATSARSWRARARSPARATPCCCRRRARATTCSAITRSAGRSSASSPRPPTRLRRAGMRATADALS
jgi:UDP-N-acetylmuramoylalanine--D-glutamate ligase